MKNNVNQFNSLPADFEKNPSGLDFAISQGLYALEPFHCCERMRSFLDSFEKLEFSALRENITTLVKTSYSSGYEAIYSIRKISPKGGQVTVSSIGGTVEFKIYSGSYGSHVFYVLSDDFLSLLEHTHRDFVEEAQKRNLDIPAKVKVHYPELFVKIPSQFTVEEVTKLTTPEWKKFVTYGDLQEWCQNCHKTIKKWRDLASKATTHSSEHLQDFEDLVNEELHRIDLYRWLQNHVKAGGTFYVEN